MKRQVATVLAAAFLAVMPSVADDKNKPMNRDRAAIADRAGTDAEVTYGRIKEFNAGQKVVIDVDNAIDKSFDLTEGEPVVNVAADLKVGDPVKVTEQEANGKKTVHIVKHTGGNVQHGDPGSAARADRDDADTDVTYGRIKEFNAGQKVVIDVDNAIDKSFDLTEGEPVVNVAADLKVGDPVKVTEREANGKKTVHIVKHTSGNVQHGDPGNARADRIEGHADVTYGRIKEFTGGRIVIDVDNAIDKSFELADNDPRVNVAAGLKVGDPVKVTEREVNDKKTVQIVKHTGEGVQHGDPNRNK